MCLDKTDGVSYRFCLTFVLEPETRVMGKEVKIRAQDAYCQIVQLAV